MDRRSVTKVPTLCLVYFGLDKTTCIVETKKLRDKETQKQFSDFEPEKSSSVTLRHNGKVLEAVVIASSDDEGNLNNEEKLFVEKNAHLFNDASSSLKPSQSENRKRKNPPIEEASPSLSSKKTKAGDSEKDEVQLLAEFVKEQSQKQADLKKKRSEHPKLQTVETGVQCGSPVVLKQKADASVQTDYHDVTKEFKEQVQNLTEVVKQLTAPKCIHQHEPKTPTSPLFEDDQFLDTAVMDVIRNFCHNPTPSPPQESASTAHESQPIHPPARPSNEEERSPVYLPQVTQPRQPLMSVDQNVIPQPLRVTSHGPTDEQRRKVGAIVDLGTDLSTTALACVDVLFTDDEMAKGNVSGSKGFQQLDSSKLRFLISLLQRKFDSPSFSEEWSQITARINTKCRGKRRTLIQRLKKHTFT